MISYQNVCWSFISVLVSLVCIDIKNFNCIVLNFHSLCFLLFHSSFLIFYNIFQKLLRKNNNKKYCICNNLVYFSSLVLTFILIKFSQFFVSITNLIAIIVIFFYFKHIFLLIIFHGKYSCFLLS